MNAPNPLDYLRESLADVERQYNFENGKYLAEVYSVGPVDGRRIEAADMRLRTLRSQRMALTGSIKFYEKHQT